MGRTEINDRIGLHENIGQIAEPNQPTCISEGCTKVKSSCVRLILYSFLPLQKKNDDNVLSVRMSYKSLLLNLVQWNTMIVKIIYYLRLINKVY